MAVNDNEIWNYLKDKDFKQLKQLLNELNNDEVLKLIYKANNQESLIIFRLLNKEMALEVFELMEVSVQQRLLEKFTDERAIEIFASLQPDDRIKLIDELPAAVAKRLLSSLSHTEREMTSLLLGYKAGSAGRAMTPKYIRLRKDMTASEALQKVRTAGSDMETVYHLYVTDNARHLEGEVSLIDIVMAEPEKKVDEIMTKDPIKAYTETEEEDVAHLLKEQDLLAVPVVDMEERLVGVITVDDAIDILEDEAADADLNKAGFSEISKTETDRSRILISGSVFKIWRLRVPFLIVTMIGGMFAGLMIEQFESTLASIISVAFFMPVIMNMGGNVGGQSSTIFTRALVLGQINFSKFIKQLAREMLVGLSMGILLGAFACLITSIWQASIMLGIVVGLSLAITVTFSTMLGFLVPYLLIKLGFDQAVGTNPLITTINDISGLIIYFLLVSLFLM
ncbi:MAG: magnesium transporter [Clostridia bacterium]|nr:magnesium transporter [Clostridia bacterium]